MGEGICFSAMTTKLISEELKKALHGYLQEHPKSDLLPAYLFFLEKRLRFKPVLFVAGKKIYESADKAIEQLQTEGKLWHEAQIQIRFDREAVNEETKKIYICPFSGKVFGDNTHPNPQDAIYNWVSKCPENTERIGGLPVKRFFVSEDSEVIKNYIKERKAPLTKTVYSSVVSGKLFNSPEAVARDFRGSYLKPITLAEAVEQDRYELESALLDLVQAELDETKISEFVEELAEDDTFTSYVNRWVE